MAAFRSKKFKKKTGLDQECYLCFLPYFPIRSSLDKFSCGGPFNLDPANKNDIPVFRLKFQINPMELYL